MLEHQKIVLRGVSHDKSLFRKELIKSMAWLNANDQTELRSWVSQIYRDQYPNIIKDILDPSDDLPS